MKKTKFLAVCLIIAMIFLVGCGSKDEDEVERTSARVTEKEETSDDTTEEEIETSEEETETQTSLRETESSEDVTEPTTQQVVPTPTQEQTQPTTPAPTQPPTETPAPTQPQETGGHRPPSGNVPTADSGMTHPIMSFNAGTTADQAATTIVNSLISSSMTAEEKVRVLHDYLVRHVRYDVEGLADMNNMPASDFTPEGALILRVAVCEGYAEAFQILCQKAGIPCEIVTGSATSDGVNYIAHAWNMVQIDGAWYQVDVTFDDPIIDGTSAYEDGSNLSRGYYLVTDAIIYLDHIADNARYVCTSERYIYRENFVDSQAKIEELMYNTFRAAGKVNTYSFKISYNQSQASAIQGYISAALQSVLDRYCRELNCGAGCSMTTTSGGNAVYGTMSITINMTWN